MQITDLVGKYSRNQTSGTEELSSAKSNDKMVSTLREMEPGSVFEGTVSQMKNGKVTLALGNGQTVEARIEGNVRLTSGNSMFFQVKSNDGETIALRPYSGLGGNAGNPVLYNALTAAQVPVTERNLSMVDAMMQEQMPIGKQNVLDMARVISSNPNLNVSTLVQMTKAGLPITEVAAGQFETYLDGTHAILGEIEQTTGAMIDLMGEESITPEQRFSLLGSFVETFVNESGDPTSVLQGQSVAGSEDSTGQESVAPQVIAGQENAPDQNIVTGQTSPEQTMTGQVASEPESATGQSVTSQEDVLGQVVSGQENTQESQAIAQFGAGQEIVAGQTSPEQAVTGQAASPTIGEIIGEKGIEQLARQLQQVPTLAGNTELFPAVDQEEVYVDTFSDSGEQAEQTAETSNQQTTLSLPDESMTASEFLSKVYEALGEKKEYGFSGLDRLLQGKEMQTILRSVAEEQWTVKPQELAEKDRMNAFYEKLDHQLTQMADAVKAAGLGQTAFSASAAQVQGNIEFMNQVNQLYTYVQIPLQMAGEHANGELYVYTNGRRHVDPDEELTAFLHLDMEHLGSTDVSVRMKGKQVRTNFYLSDDEAFRLVEEHLPALQKRLEEKGYNCKLQVLGECETDLSPEERFGQMIGKQPTSRGVLQRYSFDMRA